VLREVRRAAGEARDWDVFQAMMLESEELRPPDTGTALHFLVGFAAARRMAAQDRLAAEASGWEEDLDRRSKEVLERLHDPEAGPSTLGERAVAEMIELTWELADAADPVPTDYEELHQVRILGKKLRYAMELFAECFAAPFRERLYPSIEELQAILGTANDSHVAGEHLAAARDFLCSYRPEYWPVVKSGIEALAQAHARRVAVEREHFAEWLPRWQELLVALPLETLRIRDDTPTHGD
jgi:CHAD domain-containing protein